MAVRHAALFIALCACSGAGNQDLFEGSSTESDVQGTLPTPTPSPSPSPSNAPTSTTTPPSAPPPAAPAPTPQPETCVAEKENNNTQANANEFKTCFKGQLSNNNDVDFGVFTVPAGTKSTAWTHKESGGKVAYRFQMEGLPIDVGPGIDGELRLTAGETYVVRVAPQNTGGGGGTKTWELNLTFK